MSRKLGASLAVNAARKLATWAASAVSVFAESANVKSGRLLADRAGEGGASSSTTKALVPPMPTELTPARRGAAPTGNGNVRVLTKNGERSNGMRGLGLA